MLLTTTIETPGDVLEEGVGLASGVVGVQDDLERGME